MVWYVRVSDWYVILKDPNFWEINWQHRKCNSCYGAKEARPEWDVSVSIMQDSRVYSIAP